MDTISMTSPEIDRYATEHTTQLPSYLADLPAVTRERMGSAGMISGPVVAGLLQTLVGASGARRVLEIGTFTGFSALMMAEALPEDGTLITCDQNPKSAEVAREFFAKSPHGHKIELRLGPALDTIRSLTGPFDFVFIDADHSEKAVSKDFYGIYEYVSPDGLIILHDTNPETREDTEPGFCGDAWRFAQHLVAVPYEAVTLPFHPGLTIIRKRSGWGPQK